LPPLVPSPRARHQTPDPGRPGAPVAVRRARFPSSPPHPGCIRSAGTDSSGLSCMPFRGRRTSMKRIAFAVAALLLAISSFAQVTVKEPWVRATVAAQKVTGAFMQLTSAKDMKLVGVRSPIAGRAEIHEMLTEQDVMKMRAVASIPLPAGKPVVLASGGFHVMLFDLRQEV